jgi:hypothetical protein
VHPTHLSGFLLGVLAVVGLVGQNFKAAPGSMWVKKEESSYFLVTRWVGSAFFIAVGLLFIYLSF